MNGTKNREFIQKEAYNAAFPLDRRTVVMSVGAGKTKVALELSKEYPTVHVVIPKVSMKKTWLNEVEKHKYSTCIKFITYKGLNNYDPKDIKFLILDEVHSVTINHADWLRKKYTGPILGLTGTPPKFGHKEEIIKYNFPICYEIYEDEVIDLNIINNYQIFVHAVPLSTVKNIPIKRNNDTAKTYFFSEFSVYQWVRIKNDPILTLAMMSKFTSKLSYIKLLSSTINNKTIVFVNKKDQADELGLSYHSNNSNSEKNLEDFVSGKIDRLYAVQQLNEGVNIPNLESGIILHAYSNPRITRQRIGRLLRLSPDKVCNVHILCYKDTVEETWVKNSLESLDQSKIHYVTNLI
jgi:superfamily II DNA or RNA helicase